MVYILAATLAWGLVGLFGLSTLAQTRITSKRILTNWPPFKVVILLVALGPTIWVMLLIQYLKPKYKKDSEAR